jgi:SNF2 family DNA or RNA helicase
MTKERFLIFCHFHISENLVAELLDELGILYGRVDSSGDVVERAATIKEFRKVESPMQCLIISTPSGACALNLTTASTALV